MNNTAVTPIEEAQHLRLFYLDGVIIETRTEGYSIFLPLVEVDSTNFMI